MKTYFRLLGYLRPYIHLFIFALFCMSILAATTGIYAYMVGPLVRYIFVGGQTGFEILGKFGTYFLKLNPDRETIKIILPIAIVIVAFIRGMSYFGQLYIMGLIGQRISRDIRIALFEKIIKFDIKTFDRFKIGDLISRCTNDTKMLEQAVTFATGVLIRDSLQVIVLVGLTFYLDFKLASIFFLVVPTAIYPIYRFSKMVRERSQSAQSDIGRMTNFLQEKIPNIRIVKTFLMEEIEKERFKNINNDYYRVYTKMLKSMGGFTPVMETLGAIALAGVIIYATKMVSTGRLDPAHFISFFATVMILYQPLKSFGNLNNILQPGIASANRIFEVLDTPNRLETFCLRRDQQKIRPLQLKDSIEFRDVFFSYSNHTVLKGINLKIQAGQKIALVGKSGQGKSTLVSLLPRFYDPDSGSITIDGKDIRKIDLSVLRASIAIVPQNPVIFNTTVLDNVAYTPHPVDKDRVIYALKKAYALDFVKRMSNGIYTVIGSENHDISGGEKQRIAIARAIYKDAPIIILDEATSSLDSSSESKIKEALEYLLKSRTALIIAHRLSTIYDCDYIVVIDDGKIVATGTHDELIKRSTIYEDFYRQQIIPGYEG